MRFGWPRGPGEAKGWAQALVRQCQDAKCDLAFIAPWTSLPESPSGVDGFPGLEEIPTLRELARIASGGLARTCGSVFGADATNMPDWTELQRLVSMAAIAQQRGSPSWNSSPRSRRELARMEYDFLFDETRHLWPSDTTWRIVGADASPYDLLASEARLSTFVAIAQGQIPQESWFALGRG